MQELYNRNWNESVFRGVQKGGIAPVSQEVYEIVALGARYLFALLMVVIVARAWRITVIDSRRAQTLRRISPETGISGELVVLEGGDQARRGMKYPVIREGLIGSSRRADIRVRHRSVRRRGWRCGPTRARPSATAGDARRKP